MARITMRQAITDALREEMKRDESVFIMGEEVGVWGGTYAVTRGFYDEFGEKRVRDTPISEMVIGGAATGAAMNGLRPVAEFMTINFAMLALDAIVNHAAKIHYMFGGQMKVPVVFRAPGGGGRQLGATHSHTPDVIFAHFPGLKVVSPGTPYDAKGLLKAANTVRRERAAQGGDPQRRSGAFHRTRDALPVARRGTGGRRLHGSYRGVRRETGRI